jgi:DNA-binding response OmpR family regulator
MEREKIDLIIVDLTLMEGEMTGYDMCLRIKQDSRFEAIPIILLCDPRIPTGIGMEYRIELEASSLLVKPVNMDRLCLEIKSLMTSF